MRYFFVQYIRKPNGQMDEIVSVSNKIKQKDYQSQSVILDFQTRTVIQASVAGVKAPKDFGRIKDYYRHHYMKLIDQMEGANMTGEVMLATTDPLDPNTAQVSN